MALRDNPLGGGAVVWTVEPGRAASRAGLRVGDVVLSVEGVLTRSIDGLAHLVGAAGATVSFELAGAAPSRLLALTLERGGARGISMLPTCGVGVFVSELSQAGADSELQVGDTILSVGGRVPASCKDAARMIARGGGSVHLVVIGNAPPPRARR